MLLLLLLGCPSKDPGETGDTHDTGDTADTFDSGDTGWSATDEWGARYDCGPMDPADPAPLGGRIALTFDDGPDPDITPRVLAVLREHEVPAAFFYVGANAADLEVDAIIEEVVADPLFDIGNHTWDHVDLLGWSAAEARQQMEDTNALLAEYGVEPAFFRFPYGEGTCDQVDAARALGMHVTGWHIDTADWCYAMGDGTCTDGDYWRVPDEWRSDMIGNTMEQFFESDGGTVLFHDVWDFTADELEELIVEAKAAGFTFVHLDDLSAFPKLNADQPARLPWMGQACPVDADPCWQVENFSWCEPTGGAGPNDGVCVLPCGSQPCFSRDGGEPSYCVTVAGDAWCLSAAGPLNGDCEAMPGTVPAEADGRMMCVPADWLD